MNLESNVCGYYKLSATNTETGESRDLTDWFKNLITDGGMDRIAENQDWLTYCQVGTGSTTPQYSDSSLANRIAGTNSLSGTATNGCAQSSPYFVYTRKTFRFTAGTVSGNITEVGVGWAISGSLFSRSLILDVNGDPTSITVLSSETLDVTYEGRYYIPLVDTSGSIVLNGVNYNWTGRAANAASNTQSQGWYIGSNGENESQTWTTAYTRDAYDGSIGAITSIPSGNRGVASQSVSAYVNGTHYIDLTLTFGLTTANFVAGINALSFVIGAGMYQIGFSPAIPKTSNDVFTIKIRHSWSRG